MSGEFAGLLVQAAPYLVTGIFSLLTAGLSARLSSGRWTSLVDRELSLLERLPGQARGARDDLVVEMLRRDVFDRTFSGLGYEWRGDAPVPRARGRLVVAVQGIAPLAVNVAAWWLLDSRLGIRYDVALSCFLSYALVFAALRVLPRWPRRTWNPFYAAAASRAAVAEALRALDGSMETERLRKREDCQTSQGEQPGAQHPCGHEDEDAK